VKNKIFNFLKNIQSFLSKFGINKNTPGAYFVYNFLHKVFWPYQSIIEIQESKIYINPREESYSMRETLEGYVKGLIHEKSTTDLFKRTVKRGDTVVDLGANIGYFSLLAARLVGPGGKVFSFEPEPKNFKYLKKNIKINNYTQVKAYQKAVSNRNGKTKLFVCSYDTGHHTINQNKGIEAYKRGRVIKEQSIKIETVTLDNFLRNKVNKVDVIKMDVEGAEYLALMGMDEILRKNQDIKMFVEFFPLLIKKMGNSPEEFIKKLLEDYSFSIYVIPDDYSAMVSRIKKLSGVEEAMSLKKRRRL